MIQVTIRNLKNDITHLQAFDDLREANLWIAQMELLRAFGKPERWVYEEDLTLDSENKSNAIASQEVGGPDELGVKYKFRAEYTVELVDLEGAAMQKKINEEAFAYLNNTDWIIVRFLETRKPIPEEVISKRAAARASIKKV